MDLDYLYRWVLADSCYFIIPQVERCLDNMTRLFFFFHGCREELGLELGLELFIPAVFFSLPSQEVCTLRLNIIGTQENVCFLVYDFQY